MNLDLVICSTLSQSGGGRETWLYNFLFEWAKRFKDTNVRIYSLKKSDDNVVKNIKLSFPNIKIESHEVLLSHSFIPKGFAFALNIKNLYNTNTNNHNVIVAVGGLHEILACAFIKLRLSIDSKMILWLRSIYVHEKYDKIPNFLRPIISSIEIYFIRNFFSLVIANGKDTYEYYYKKNIDAYVIPNSIPLIKYNNIVKLPSKKLRIAYIGRLSKVKGICEFIESIKISAKLDFFFDMSFHVIGDGPFREEVENIAHQGLLQYHGAIPNIEMPEILKKTDCCVALTFSGPKLGGGGVSNALVEQMATGQIIIAWDNYIFHQALNDNEAYFVKQGDSQQLARCYQRIILNKQEAYAYAQNAKLGSSRYNIINHMDLFLNVAKQI